MYIDYGYGVKLSKEIDLNLTHMWRNDYRVYQTCRQQDLLTWKEHEAYWNGLPADSSFYSIVADNILPNKPKTIGVCGLTGISQLHQRAEYSLYIQPNYMGQKYGSKALKTLLEHGFKTLNLNCIWGEVFEFNEGGLRMAEKLGFEVEGKLRQRYFKEGQFRDTHIISMLRSEFIDGKFIFAK